MSLMDDYLDGKSTGRLPEEGSPILSFLTDSIKEAEAEEGDATLDDIPPELLARELRERGLLEEGDPEIGEDDSDPEDGGEEGAETPEKIAEDETLGRLRAHAFAARTNYRFGLVNGSLQE